ncbi:MAG: TonB-dependent receptor [Gammaproteobacteria bacterium]|nr:MAG: TonB-dependent receptor [Gammaproteobacteria bacterium]
MITRRLPAVLAASVLAPIVLQSAQAQQPADTRVLTEIIVTADPIGGRTADELIQPVSVLHGDELARRLAGSIGEILDGLPGVANADFGPGVGRPTVRGQQGSRVVVLDDGLPVADVSGEGVDHAVAIDARGAEQIEIFRGPMTLLYGSGAAGGVVNVRSSRFLPDFAPSSFARLDASYSPNGDDRQVDLQFEHALDEAFGLRGALGLRRSNDFSIKGFQEEDQTEGRRGRLQNSNLSSDTASLTGMFRQDWGHIGLGASRWRTDYGIPEVFDPQRLRGDGSDDFERITADYERIDLRAEILDPLPGFTTLRLKSAWTRFEQQESEFKFNRADGSFREAIVEAEFQNDEFDTRIDLVHAPIAGWQGVLGLQFSDRDFFADDPRGADRGFYVRPNRTRTSALYLVEELRTGFGRLEFGGRIERTASRADDVIGSRVEGVTQEDGSFLPLPEQLDRRRDTPLSLSAGSIIDLDEAHHLRVALTRAQRMPSGEQLYAFGRHAAAGTWEVGNPELDRETYTNFELGIDRHLGRLRYDFTVFYNRADDYIFLASEDDGTGNPVFVNDIGNRAGEGAAADCAPGAGGLCRLRNQLVTNQQADAEFYGAELAGSFQLVEGPVPLTLHVSGDLVRGKLRDGGNLPRITPARAGVGLATRLEGIDMRVDFQRVDRQSRIGEAESTTDGFNLLSLDLAWQLPGTGTDTTLYLRGRNLLDEDGRRHQSFFKDDAPIIGRAFYLGFRTQLGGR